MLTVAYEKVIPYPYATVLSQYYDYEHIAHVHPHTLGEYRVVESSVGRIVYEQTWPAGCSGGRARSTVEHTWTEPGTMTFRFVAGRYKGVRVRTHLEARDAGTVVAEAYDIPFLPDWRWLASLARPFVLDIVERVWEEDLRVEVCRDGWPGVPGALLASGTSPAGAPAGPPPGTWPLPAGPAASFAPGMPRVVGTSVGELLVVRRPGCWVVVSNRCPHAGGPMALGEIGERELTCPWHGARFDLRTGAPLNAVTSSHLPAYDAAETEGVLAVTPRFPAERARG
ncbi:MAG: Rieske (2Fe-2S) protein [Vicinamibacterales bacterium]